MSSPGRTVYGVNEATIRWLMAPELEDRPTTLEELVNRPAWHREAACRNEPTETFWPARGGSYARARRICAGCPVRSECLAVAMADAELDGMWGGTIERQRREARARAGAA